MRRTVSGGFVLLLCSLALMLPGSLRTTRAADSPAGSTSAEDRPKPVAVVAGEEITAKELAARLKEVPPKEWDDTVTEDGKKDLLHRLIHRRLLSREAERLGLDRVPEIALELKLAREKILFDAYLERQVLAQVKVTEQEAREYFEAHQDRFLGQTFPEAKKAVLAELRDEKGRQLALQRIKELWERAHVRIDDQELAKLDFFTLGGRRRSSAAQIIRLLEKKKGQLPEELRKALEEGKVQVGPPPKKP